MKLRSHDWETSLFSKAGGKRQRRYIDKDIPGEVVGLIELCLEIDTTRDRVQYSIQLSRTDGKGNGKRVSEEILLEFANTDHDDKNVE